ncbi:MULTISPECIES: Spy/CpxP family protein refolding chaperone [unclassified Acidovorax]|uniref:Spy/CpxP family protein refolding chaperone n=1 Tax=unclassified Acidovorax TaxID=2684926 RepID=UPI00070D4D05|nr:Spy/CpxP family protein refolding chaperone [Acidovorax sp. Root219]KRC28980.1 hypothetical protein ASE28_18780 [Acidovorax sp. Root219]
MAFLSRHTVAAAVLAALALPVLAQPTPANPPAVGAAAAPDARKGPGEHRERHQAHMAQRAAALKAQLKLTPAQEPAWNTFTASMQPGERQARLDHKDMDKLTTPERIDRMRAMRAQHAAEADRRGEATKAFYAVLTPEQQKTFDARAQRMGPRGEHGKHGPHGHRGHGDKPAGAAAAPAAQK